MKLQRPAHTEKEKIVNLIADKIKNCQGMVIAEYKNLTVAHMMKLREMAREKNVFIKVYKDSLVRRAVSLLNMNDLLGSLTQQNIFLFSDDEALVPAKLVAEFAKKVPDLKLKAGVYEGKIMNTEEINEIASMPSKEELYAMFASALIYPLRQFMLLTKEIAKSK